ncbi:MAG: nitrilase-related carbon-nitrogen hydrolase [Verrucomicrobiota bacterium]
MSYAVESHPGFTPISWRQATLLSVIAVACFHLAYTPAKSGLLALGIVGYVICLVQLARLRTTRQSFYAGLATAFACFAPQLECFWRIFGAAAIPLWLVLALWLALFVTLTHLAIVHLGLKRAAFLTPFFWTGLEYFRSELYYLKFAWMNVGYAFAESPIIPWDYVGVYGIGFVAAAIGALFLVVYPKQLRKIALWKLLLVVAFAGALLAVLFPSVSDKHGFGSPNLVLAGVQSEFPESDQIERSLSKVLIVPEEQQYGWLRGITNVDLVVLSEYTMDGEPTDALKDWCRTNQKFLIVGGKDNSPGTNFYNTAYVISTNGEIVFKQVKSVPIQFFKDGLPAPEQKLWASPWGKIGICICYDMCYSRVTDELVRQGAQMIIAPTMDVADWGRHQHELHARVAPVRAAEYGIPTFRLASSGISQGVNASGWVQSSAPFPGEGEMIFFGVHLGAKGSVPPDRLLAPLCVLITAVFVLRTLAVTWRRQPASP